MRKVSDLGDTEIRILGALLEKEQATPDYYPLTVNALLAACNQKSNRNPVTSLSETEVVESLDALRRDVLAWRSDGARTERWSQSISRRLELDPEEKAILTLLMLRGPQTPGELRSRSGRLHAFDDVGQIDAALRRMAVEERELVVELPRSPGQKENRWAHQLGEAIDVPAIPASPVTTPRPSAAPRPAPAADDRLERLERRLNTLEATVATLRQELDDLLS
jgi:uncharacterized protein YceH (UPF0502 family)